VVTVTNTNPPTPPSGWGDDNWTFAVATDTPLSGGMSLAAAVGQQPYFNYFVTTAVVAIRYNFNPFSGDNGGGGRITVPPRERLV
jgi:hypothetical protein